MGLNAFHNHKRINYKILTDNRMKIGDFLSVYGAKETQKVEIDTKRLRLSKIKRRYGEIE